MASPRPNRRLHAGALPFALLLGAASQAACAHGECRGRDEARCAWEKAERAKRPGQGQDSGDATGYVPGDPLATTTPDQWDRATEVLGEAWTMMGEGVDRAARAEVVRSGCAEEPTTRPGEQDTWTCQLSQAPVLAGREFMLEVGRDGVIALTAFNLGEGEAVGLLEDASRRWRPLCADDFAPYTPPRASGEFRGCVLADGPLLVLSRFMPDPTAPLWQVSLAVMPAG